jgi:hypothetical protein
MILRIFERLKDTEIEKYCLEFVPNSARNILTKDHEICDSCKSILEERIRKPYNKTNFELTELLVQLQKELNETKKELKKLKTDMELIEK